MVRPLDTDVMEQACRAYFWLVLEQSTEISKRIMECRRRRHLLHVFFVFDAILEANKYVWPSAWFGSHSHDDLTLTLTSLG